MSIRESSVASFELPEVERPHMSRSPPELFGSELLEEMESNQVNDQAQTGIVSAAETHFTPFTQAGYGNTEPPPSAQHQDNNVEIVDLSSGPSKMEEEEEEEEGEPEEDIDPAEKISDFDWDELHARYHEAMNKADIEEQKAFKEWAHLMEMFNIWGQAGLAHETGRSFSRLKTRTAYVQHSEEELEKTRKHYIEVVKAFESALNLLRNVGSRR